MEVAVAMGDSQPALRQQQARRVRAHPLEMFGTVCERVGG